MTAISTTNVGFKFHLTLFFPKSRPDIFKRELKFDGRRKKTAVSASIYFNNIVGTCHDGYSCEAAGNEGPRYCSYLPGTTSLLSNIIDFDSYTFFWDQYYKTIKDFDALCEMLSEFSSGHNCPCD